MKNNQQNIFDYGSPSQRSTPIPLLKRDEWQKERTAKAKEIMRLSTGGQSIGGSNGRSAQKDACSGKNTDELTNWDGTKKRGLGI